MLKKSIEDHIGTEAGCYCCLEDGYSYRFVANQFDVSKSTVGVVVVEVCNVSLKVICLWVDCIRHKTASFQRKICLSWKQW